MTDAWTTRVLPEFTAHYDVEDIHSAVFTPKGWPGKGSAVTLLIPECEMQLCRMDPQGQPVTLVNQPQANRNVKMASRLLPNHERIALERMYEAETRARSDLN